MSRHKFIHILTLLQIILAPICVRGQQNTPTICLETGACYEGSWKIYGTLKYASFQGIRYAQAPVGNLRFKLPLPYYDTEGVYDVSKDIGIACPQNQQGGPVGQEDCLLLNVYVPEEVFNKDDDMNLPVMVYIHGGGLSHGRNAFSGLGPNEFIKRNTILVAINYRLGAFGFLSLGSNEVPGNMGMRDQNMALKWVNQNIQLFGGDPNLVTIFGESAGALSVAYQILSPLSSGLFKRAILQSGPSINPSWGTNTQEQALKYGQMLKTALHCEDLGCLQSKSSEEILNVMSLGYHNAPFSTALVWQPVPDAEFTSSSDHPFLPEFPEQLLESGQFNTDIDVIIGTNADEGLLVCSNVIKHPDLWPAYQEHFEIGGTKTLFGIAEDSDITSEDTQNMKKLVEFYFGSINGINENHSQELIDIFTDSFFLFGTYKTIGYMQKHNMTVYEYFLSYDDNGNGVNHAEDLRYIFDPPFGSRPDCCHLR